MSTTDHMVDPQTKTLDPETKTLHVQGIPTELMRDIGVMARQEGKTIKTWIIELLEDRRTKLNPKEANHAKRPKRSD